MAVEKKIKEEIRDLKNVKTLIQTYEEIAASRMQKVKNSVLSNREFLGSLYDIYRQVKHSYDEYMQRVTVGKSKKIGVLPRNGKTVSVLLSANTGLYGDITRRTFELFHNSLRIRKSDVVVVGKLGQTLFEGVKKELGALNYRYFDLSDTASTSADFSEIISYITSYETVIVYHGKFESILSQTPIEEFLTGELSDSETQRAVKSSYIFEPSIEDIMGFFESEILAAIFEQSLHESSLSKYAARMINLDRAVVNIGDKLRLKNFEQKRAHHRIINKKQLGLLSSISLWG